MGRDAFSHCVAATRWTATCRGDLWLLYCLEDQISNDFNYLPDIGGSNLVPRRGPEKSLIFQLLT